eukprot:12499816-Alexandrium_andersonii.AAC.1
MALVGVREGPAEHARGARLEEDLGEIMSDDPLLAELMTPARAPQTSASSVLADPADLMGPSGP